MARGGLADYVLAMKKRVLSGVLWFLSGWYAGAMIAYFIGISPLLAPILGATAAFLIAGDPRGVIWPRKAPTPATLAPEPNPA
jgi:hypothetical protein